MKKFLRYHGNTDAELLEYWPDCTHWITNNHREDIGRIDKGVRFGRGKRVAFRSDEDVFLTSECLRDIADFIDSQEGRSRPSASHNKPQAKIPSAMEVHDELAKFYGNENRVMLAEVARVIETIDRLGYFGSAA